MHNAYVSGRGSSILCVSSPTYITIGKTGKTLLDGSLGQIEESARFSLLLPLEETAVLDIHSWFIIWPHVRLNSPTQKGITPIKIPGGGGRENKGTVGKYY